MVPKIVNLEEKKLAGKHLSMSFFNNKTTELWKAFLQEKNEIPNTIGTNLYSVQLYSDGFFDNFDPNALFEKWAAVEVSIFKEIPHQMEIFTIAGLYAIFDYKGNPNQGENVFRYIFSEWLPQSKYTLDSRLHFEILGEKYKNNDPESEEQICIPIRLK